MHGETMRTAGCDCYPTNAGDPPVHDGVFIRPYLLSRNPFASARKPGPTGAARLQASRARGSRGRLRYRKRRSRQLRQKHFGDDDCPRPTAARSIPAHVDVPDSAQHRVAARGTTAGQEISERAMPCAASAMCSLNAPVLWHTDNNFSHIGFARRLATGRANHRIASAANSQNDYIHYVV